MFGRKLGKDSEAQSSEVEDKGPDAFYWSKIDTGVYKQFRDQADEAVYAFVVLARYLGVVETEAPVDPPSAELLELAAERAATAFEKYQKLRTLQSVYLFTNAQIEQNRKAVHF